MLAPYHMLALKRVRLSFLEDIYLQDIIVYGIIRLINHSMRSLR
jgi:hypothetical protein